MRNMILAAIVAVAGVSGVASADEASDRDVAKSFIRCGVVLEAYSVVATENKPDIEKKIAADMFKKMTVLLNDAAKASLELSDTLKLLAEDKPFEDFKEDTIEEIATFYRNDEQYAELQNFEKLLKFCSSVEFMEDAMSYLKAVGRDQMYSDD